MSYYNCPNSDICKKRIRIGSETKMTPFEGNTAKLHCTPFYDDRTGEYFLRPDDPLPVCWSCKASYNDEGDDETNVYLSFVDSIECCICLKTDNGVSFPHCDHYTCIDCHNRCWFGPEPVKVEFPYPEEIRKLYLSDSQNSIWQKDPKIKEYIEQDNKAEHDRMDQWEQETNLRKCPLCRK
jgi:hypothetical protein